VHAQATWGPAAGTGSREARVIAKDRERVRGATAGPPAIEGDNAHGAGGPTCRHSLLFVWTLAGPSDRRRGSTRGPKLLWV
jgi:hypothetical protein